MNLFRYKYLFPQIIINRGQDYFDQGLVKITGDNEQFSSIEVRGDQKYKVIVTKKFTRREDSLKCSCPYFTNGSFCKHIWAGLLELERFESQPFREPIVATPSEMTPVTKKTAATKIAEKPVTGWRKIFQTALKPALPAETHLPILKSTKKYELRVALDLDDSEVTQNFVFGLFRKDPLKPHLGFRPFAFKLDDLEDFHLPEDQEILKTLFGTSLAFENSYFSHQSTTSKLKLLPKNLYPFLDLLTQKKKLFSVATNESPTIVDGVEFKPLNLADKKYEFNLVLEEFESHSLVKAALKAEDAEILFLQPGDRLIQDCLIRQQHLYFTNLSTYPQWLNAFGKRFLTDIPKEELPEFLSLALNQASAPDLVLPESMKFKTLSDVQPKPLLKLKSDLQNQSYEVYLDFLYGDTTFSSDWSAPAKKKYHYQLDTKTRVERNLNFEAEKIKLVQSFPLSTQKNGYAIRRDCYGFIKKRLLKEFLVVFSGVGFEIFLEGNSLQSATSYHFDMKSKSDWFELSLDLEFGKFKISYPQLLENLRKNDPLIRLGQNEIGLIPDDWFTKFSHLENFYSNKKMTLTPVQALFFYASLDPKENILTDSQFEKIKDFIQKLNNLKEAEPTPHFKGTLRQYQNKGLAWLEHLVDFQFGGILADEMGLGKTIQILSLLDKRRKSTSLIVAPKTLIFNWIKEVQKFTPHLTVLNFTGQERVKYKDDFNKFDVVLTTYQTLLREIEFFNKKEFQFFIMDEAHNIKNRKSQIHKACELIHAENKLALTGTPVENSLSDLFSILSTVNPGLVSNELTENWQNQKDPEQLKKLSKALQPFLLRRTKSEVIKDLPEKSVEVLYSELNSDEQKKYSELKAFYWSQLSKKFSEKGFDRSKIEILEALLRLRQASCHLGLLDESHVNKPSSKFEMLLEQLDIIFQEGHKALVFSQFTSLLALFRRALDHRKIKYAYLDGKTKNREAPVEEFQTDPKTQLFLISLKAGGTGLNLTEADYVYILDPWWNPAVENQAIDRAHRIGQKNKVFAYKMISKGTIEEKILDLQRSKTDLFNQILTNENSLVKSLDFEDLKALLT